MPDTHQLNAIIRAAHQAGWYVKTIGRSPDRFDLLLTRHVRVATAVGSVPRARLSPCGDSAEPT